MLLFYIWVEERIFKAVFFLHYWYIAHVNLSKEVRR